jgi:hypothetical protein
MWLVEEHLYAEALREDVKECEEDKISLTEIIGHKEAIINEEKAINVQKDGIISQYATAFNKERADHNRTKRKLKFARIQVKAISAVALVFMGVYIVDHVIY